MDKFLEAGEDIYDKNKENVQAIIDFRESIYAFNLKYFFEFPVKIDRAETLNIWKIISNNYFVKQKHDEINAQVLDLTNIIVKNQDKQKLEYEKKRREAEEKIKNEIQERDKTLQTKLTTIGLAIALAPILIDIANLIVEYIAFKQNININIAKILAPIAIVVILLYPKIREKIFNLINGNENEKPET